MAFTEEDKKRRAVICQKQISVEGNGHCCHRPSSNWETNQEDNILIKVLRQKHGYGAKRFLKEFSNKGWCLSSVTKLLKKIDETDTVDRKPGSGKKRTTRTVENIELVEGLALGQENAPGTHKTVASTSTVVCP